MEKKIVLNKKSFSGNILLDKKDLRSHINSSQIQPNGSVISTNGAALISISAPTKWKQDQLDKAVYIGKDNQVMIAKQVNKNGMAVIQIDGEKIEVNADGGKVGFDNIDMDYPETNDLLNRLDEPTFTININAGLLKKVCNILEKFEANNQESCKFEFISNEHPVKITKTDDKGQTVTAIVMPCRAEKD